MLSYDSLSACSFESFGPGTVVWPTLERVVAAGGGKGSLVIGCFPAGADGAVVVAGQPRRTKPKTSARNITPKIKLLILFLQIAGEWKCSLSTQFGHFESYATELTEEKFDWRAECV